MTRNLNRIRKRAPSSGWQASDVLLKIHKLMPNLGSIDVTIEAVVEAGSEVHVIFTVTREENWAVTEDSNIGGIPIRPWLSQPRALDDEGRPRFDIFNIVLANSEDASSIKVGEVRPLLVDLDPQKPAEPQR